MTEKVLCKMCNKEIPEKRLLQGKDTCCHRCAIKASNLRPEVSAKKSEAQIKRFKDPNKYKSFCESMSKPETRAKLSAAGFKRYEDPEEHAKQSNRTKQMHKDPMYRQNFMNAMRSEETLDKISKAQLARFQDEEKHRSFIEAMNTKEAKKNLSKAQSSEETKQKISNTKKRNGSCNISIWEEEDYQKLIAVFPKTQRQYFDKDKYPFKADFYIPELDLIIECHYSWLHNYKPYAKEDAICQKELLTMQEKAKSSKYYKNAIYTWTDLDVRKRRCAEEHNLNWICFYYREDFNKWLNSVK